MNNSKYLEILLKNDQLELENFLISNGKGPKPICPIIFINKEEGNENGREHIND